MSEEILPVLLKRVAVTSMDDLLAAIGYGGMTATRAVNRIKDEVQKAQRQEQQRTAVDRINEAGERRSQQEQRQQKAIHGVLVEGLDNCLVKFSRCCSPVPGDDIVGFIPRGYGEGGRVRALDPRHLCGEHHGQLRHPPLYQFPGAQRPGD